MLRLLCDGIACLIHIYHSIIIFVAFLTFARVCVCRRLEIGWGKHSTPNNAHTFLSTVKSTNNRFTSSHAIVLQPSAAADIHGIPSDEGVQQASAHTASSLSIFEQNEGMKMCDHVNSISRHFTNKNFLHSFLWWMRESTRHSLDLKWSREMIVGGDV